jgi:hypothetical protein
MDMMWEFVMSGFEGFVGVRERSEKFKADKMDIKMDIKMDMIGGFVMSGFGAFTGVVERTEKFKADKMDKMDIIYINIFLSMLIFRGNWSMKVVFWAVPHEKRAHRLLKLLDKV